MTAVTVQISDRSMVSDATRHTATRRPDGTWSVSWLPGQTLTYEQAVSAMRVADAAAQAQTEGLTRVIDAAHRLWAQLDRWAAALGLSGPAAVAGASHASDDADGW